MAYKVLQRRDKEMPITLIVGDTNHQCSSNCYPPKRKPVIMRRKHVWSMKRMWAENPTTSQTRISKVRCLVLFLNKWNLFISFLTLTYGGT